MEAEARATRYEAAARASVSTDAELLADIARENLSALGTLFDRHHRRVERVLLRTGLGAADVDDVVQQTFLEVPRIARTHDGRDNCAAWLCGIAIRLAARRRRSISRLVRALTSFSREASHRDGLHPEAIVSGREELAVFARALDELGRKKREAFVLVEVEGFSAEEAGRALGVNPATMRTRLFHARAELRVAMERGRR
jgi:RNA polymerase sigma-70 factor (ECF subfamily)